MKKTLWQNHNVAAFVLALAFVTIARALPEAEWKFRQGFEVDRPGTYRVAVPLATLDHSQADFRDLRLIGPDGAELPFALLRPLSTPAQWTAPTRFNVSLRDGGTVISIDADEAKSWDAIQLITPGGRFLKAARVEGSVDGKTWETWLEGAPVFRRDGVEQTSLILPDKRAAHFRITLDDRDTAPIVVTGARLREPASEEAALESVEVKIAQSEDYAGETLLTLALPAANIDLATLEIVTPESLFTRNVRLGLRELRDGAIAERSLGSDTLYRLRLDDRPPAEKTRATMNALAPAREIALHIENGDSPALRIEAVRAQRRILFLAFEARSPGKHQLWSGNPQAKAPRYDLALVADRLRKLPATSLPFDKGAENENYHQPDALSNLAIEGAAIRVEEWKRQRGVRLESAGAQVLELDLTALAGAQPSLADLRLARGGKQLPYVVERSSLSKSIELPLQPANDAKHPNLSRWKLTLPTRGAPITRLALTTSANLFQREFRVFERRESANGDPYDMELGRISWRRTPQDKDTGADARINASSAGETVVIPITPPESAEVWLETDNGDNPAIPLTRARIHYPVTRLLFRSASTEPLNLLSGNPQASAPRYDLSLIAEALLTSEKHVAVLEAVTEDAVTVRSPSIPTKNALFWAALALVVIVLLVVVAKLLPKEKS